MVEEYFLPRSRMQELLELLKQQGYVCVGPRMRESALVYEELQLASQLPRGIQDEQKLPTAGFFITA